MIEIDLKLPDREAARTVSEALGFEIEECKKTGRPDVIPPLEEAVGQIDRAIELDEMAERLRCPKCGNSTWAKIVRFRKVEQRQELSGDRFETVAEEVREIPTLECQECHHEWKEY